MGVAALCGTLAPTTTRLNNLITATLLGYCKQNVVQSVQISRETWSLLGKMRISEMSLKWSNKCAQICITVCSMWCQLFNNAVSNISTSESSQYLTEKCGCTLGLWYNNFYGSILCQDNWWQECVMTSVLSHHHALLLMATPTCTDAHILFTCLYLSLPLAPTHTFSPTPNLHSWETSWPMSLGHEKKEATK